MFVIVLCLLMQRTKNQVPIEAVQVEFGASATGTYLLKLITGHETHHERLMIIH